MKKKQLNIQMFLHMFREIQPLKDQSECLNSICPSFISPWHHYKWKLCIIVVQFDRCIHINAQTCSFDFLCSIIESMKFKLVAEIIQGLCNWHTKSLDISSVPFCWSTVLEPVFVLTALPGLGELSLFFKDVVGLLQNQWS